MQPKPEHDINIARNWGNGRLVAGCSGGHITFRDAADTVIPWPKSKVVPRPWPLIASYVSRVGDLESEREERQAESERRFSDGG